MDFRSPQQFWWLIPFLGLLALHFYGRWKRRKELLALVDYRVLKNMVSLAALKKRRLKEVLSLLGVLLAIAAAVGPQWGPDLKEVKQRGVDVFIAVDVSRSMLAEDVSPSRLERAKQTLSQLVQKLKGNRVGVIAFAGYAAIQCPLTVDPDAARLFLEGLDTNTIPDQGTAVGDAIRLATSRFNKDDKSGRAIVLITDGEDHRSNPLEAAKEAKEKGVAIFTIGIGTAKGDVIKKRDDRGTVVEYLKHKGEMVLSRLDDSLLSKISAVTGGRSYRASSTDQEIDEIADVLNTFDKKEFGQGLHQSYKDRFRLFGILALILLLIEFFISEKDGQIQRIQKRMAAFQSVRIGKKKIAALILCFGLASTAYGKAVDHIREGNKLLKKGDLSGARGEFESALIDEPDSPIILYNLGTTAILQNQHEEAGRRLEQASRSTSDLELKSKCAYNMGYDKFLQGDRVGAIEHFKEALRFNPNDQDAKYNIEYLLSGKTPPPSMKPKDSPDSSQKKENEDNNNKQNSETDKNEAAQKEKSEQNAKENAERVLQMIQDQEKENRRKSKPISFGEGKKDKSDESVEDW